MKEQTPKQLYLARGKLYELLVNCIPPEVGSAWGAGWRGRTRAAPGGTGLRCQAGNVATATVAKCSGMLTVAPSSLAPLQIVLRKLAVELMRKLDDELKHATAADAAFYEHRLQARGWAAGWGSGAVRHAAGGACTARRRPPPHRTDLPRGRRRGPKPSSTWRPSWPAS